MGVRASTWVLIAGDGEKCLLLVVSVDGDCFSSTSLTRYDGEAGTPPGHWLGSGFSGLGDGHPRTGDQAFEAPLQLLAGSGRDPFTGDPIGLAFPAYTSAAERIEARTAADVYVVNAEARVTIWYQIRF
jgi:hypothetical protein